MPMDRKLYPANWVEIALAIKIAVSWSCQQCDRPCRQPGEGDDDLIERVKLAGWGHDLSEQEETDEFGLIEMPKLGRFTLTVAHLNHQPSDCRPDNLRALCSVCHCRYDLAAMALKKRLKLERAGQLTLPVRDL